MQKDESPKNKNNAYELKNLRFLRHLVTVLTVVMIVGFITICSVIIISFNTKINQNNNYVIPETISLGKHESLASVTFQDEIIILLLNLENGSQEIRTISSKTGKILTNTLILGKD